MSENSLKWLSRYKKSEPAVEPTVTPTIVKPAPDFDETTLEELYDEMQVSYVEWQQEWLERIEKAELTADERSYAEDTLGDYGFEVSTNIQTNIIECFTTWLSRWKESQGMVAGMLIETLLAKAYGYNHELTVETVKKWSKEKNKVK